MKSKFCFVHFTKGKSKLPHILKLMGSQMYVAQIPWESLSGGGFDIDSLSFNEIPPAVFDKNGNFISLQKNS